MSYSGRLTCRGFLVKMQHKQHFFTQKLAESAKNTTFAAKFNENLPIMSYISVSQYASSEDTKKDCFVMRAVFFVL